MAYQSSINALRELLKSEDRSSYYHSALFHSLSFSKAPTRAFLILKMEKNTVLFKLLARMITTMEECNMEYRHLEMKP